MAFTQIVEIDGVDQEQALRHLLTQWHDDQSGQAPGYLAARILADEDAPGRYLVEVDFASADEAKRNNDRAETQEWASKLRSSRAANRPIATCAPSSRPLPEVHAPGWRR